MSTTEKLLAEKKHLIDELDDLKKDLGTANLNEVFCQFYSWLAQTYQT